MYKKEDRNIGSSEKFLSFHKVIMDEQFLELGMIHLLLLLLLFPYKTKETFRTT